jgi:(2Fe-2S) ferredoxin
LQEPEHVAYGGVTLADVDELADAASAGTVVERLVVHGHGPAVPRPKASE